MPRNVSYNYTLSYLVDNLDNPKELEKAFQKNETGEKNLEDFIQNFAKFAVPNDAALKDLEKLKEYLGKVKKGETKASKLFDSVFPKTVTKSHDLIEQRQYLGDQVVEDMTPVGREPSKEEYTEARAREKENAEARRNEIRPAKADVDNKKEELKTQILAADSITQIHEFLKDSPFLKMETSAFNRLIEETKGKEARATAAYEEQLRSLKKTEHWLKGQLVATPDSNPMAGSLKQRLSDIDRDRERLLAHYTARTESIKRDLIRQLSL